MGLWPFLKGLPRIEISMHSIHYLDLVRSLLGDPHGVHAKTLGHPDHDVAQTRTSAILDYGAHIRCACRSITTIILGGGSRPASFRICGTKGAAYVKLGVNLDYPKGEPDELWIHPAGGDRWIEVPLQGTWFPDAFIGAWPTSSALRAARMRRLWAPWRTPGVPWRWSRPPINPVRTHDAFAHAAET